MTKTDIYNIALKCHGKMVTDAEVNATSNIIYEVNLCNTFYRGAVLKALGEFDWSFLTTKVIYDKDYDFPEGGWLHGYLLPQGIYKIIPRSTQPYEVMRHKYLTDEECPDIYAIMDTFEPEDTRDDFCILVGYALAYELCGLLAPNNQVISQQILQQYTWTLQSMTASQSNAVIRGVEEGGSILNEDNIPEFKPLRRGE